jgi:hypothetical protein
MNVTIEVDFYQFPDGLAFCLRQGFEQISNLSTVETVKKLRDLRLGTTIQRIGQAVQMTGCFFFVQMFPHRSRQPLIGFIKDRQTCIAGWNQVVLYQLAC